MWMTSFPSLPEVVLLNSTVVIYRPVLADPNVLLDPVVAVAAKTATSMQVCSSGANSIEL